MLLRKLGIVSDDLPVGHAISTNILVIITSHNDILIIMLLRKLAIVSDDLPVGHAALVDPLRIGLADGPVSAMADGSVPPWPCAGMRAGVDNERRVPSVGTQLRIGIADGMSIARVWACRYPK